MTLETLESWRDRSLARLCCLGLEHDMHCVEGVEFATVERARDARMIVANGLLATIRNLNDDIRDRLTARVA